MKMTTEFLNEASGTNSVSYSTNSWYWKENFAAQIGLQNHRINIKVHMRAMGHAVAWWLKQYATSRKVARSRPDEVNEFSQFT
jgi:hypothetical protein